MISSHEHSSRNDATRWGIVFLLAFGHFAGDFYAVLLACMLQDFREAFGLTITAASILINVCSLSNSMLQPVVGHFFEGFDQKRVFALGLVIAAVFLSCIGLAPNVMTLGVLVAVGGTGVALFHPSGAVLASRFAGPRRGLAMSVYSNGGAAGLAVAPIAVTLLLEYMTRETSWVLMPLGLVMAFLVFTFVPRAVSDAPPRKLPNWRSLFESGSLSVWLVFISTVVRSLVVVSITSFTVTYGTECGWTKSNGRTLLAAFMFSCAVGGVVGGFISDYVERKRLMLIASFAGGLPLLCAWQGQYAVTFLMLVLGGVILSISTPINIVVAQQLLPNRASAISGVMMGLAWSVATLALIPFGRLADLTSTGTALRVTSSLMLLAGVCVLPLPKFPPLMQRAGAQ